jgi:hypothetical protein
MRAGGFLAERIAQHDCSAAGLQSRREMHGREQIPAVCVKKSC